MNEDSKPGLLNIGSAAEYLGISIDTLRRWERKGRIQPLRSPGGHRYYSKSSLDDLFGKRYTRDEQTLRRTNEELGIDPQQIPTANVTVDSSLPDSFIAPPDTPIVNTEVTPPVPEYPIPAIMEEVEPEIPPLQQNSGSTNLLHPMDIQTPAIVAAPEIESVKEIPHEAVIPPASEPAAVPTPAVTPAPEKPALIPNTLLPERENNTLSEDEIEKRINTIIKREKKKSGPNTVLIILSAVLLIADIALLYFWFTQSRIASPIP